MTQARARILGALVLTLVELGCGNRAITASDGGADPRSDRRRIVRLDAGAIGDPADPRRLDGMTSQHVSTCGIPFTAKSNSGARCAQWCDSDADCGAATFCADSAGKPCSGGECSCHCTSRDETCIYGWQDADWNVVSICLGKCCNDDSQAWDAPVNLCPVNDPSTQLAACVARLDSSYQLVCGWICEHTDAAGVHTTYECPGPDYDCVRAYDDSTDKYCVPKGSSY